MYSKLLICFDWIHGYLYNILKLFGRTYIPNIQVIDHGIFHSSNGIPEYVDVRIVDSTRRAPTNQTAVDISVTENRKKVINLVIIKMKWFANEIRY